ncbi:flagellin [Paenibacillus sp. GSMTC-2017]|uniref:flagellin N-terminal helical domain-containing protein n=1 Tax=Paenibacillus sp. GSMTC-2017 TaxID=2794350 RepID=UPI0018DA2DFE|nr:flagellin [Paenibacillus sp. GSMTC-2017]MBH5320623.1 flagellin [Paenibacillus sp. GSMTC-2017]
MIINHNIAALNTHRQLGANSAATSKNIEKLSSGLRINRAGDDAAGLAISEKMRGQIRGLDMASKNAQDGISLIQTAEGALNETHSILQRMRELAVQSGSDTNTDSDRGEIQKEVDQLVTEIDRISNTTEFNTKKLVDGSFSGTFQIGANENQTMKLGINAMGSASLNLTSGVQVADGVFGGTAGKVLGEGSYTVKGTDLLDAKGQIVASLATNVATTAGGGTYTFAKATALNDGDTIKINAAGVAGLTKNLEAGQTNNKLAPGTYKFVGSDVFKDDVKVGTFATSVITFTDTTKGTLDLATTFGLANPAAGDTLVVKGVDVSNREQASATITAVNNALESVSAERSKLGAVQNRLEHTVNNLGTSSENLTAAESRIRDVDMAKEMMQQTKNSILAQAAQAMLAQANQQPQGVLQLLR